MTRLRLYLLATVLAALAAGATGAASWGDIVYFALYIPIWATALMTALRHRRRTDRRPWLWITGGLFAWLAGDALWPLADLFGWPDQARPAAVLWTAGYVAYGIALISMARRRAGRWLRPAVLDMLTLTTAAAMVIWVIEVSPALADAAADPVSAYLSVLSPLGDIVITVSVLLLTFSPGARGGATGLLIASAVLRIGSDLGFTLIPGEQWSVMVSTGVILLSNALLVGAGLHPRSEELTTPAGQAPTLHPARTWLLGLALLTAPAILFLRDSYAPAERATLLVLTALTTLFVLVRFTSALRSLERAERQLSFQATHDPLTGLANRDVLGTALEDSPAGTTLLYLDLDGFKAVNDTAGHAAGDAILRAVATRLRAVVRDCDTVARLGGDEFAVVLSGLSGPAAIQVAERILHDVAAPVDHDGVAHTIGASIGIADTGADAADDRWRPGALLRAADGAMYQAKRLGRGRWVAA
jgi:diguanylate cyclase (GGDEF)-like protein